ncbi:MAG: cytochrome c biogenesis protein CcdA, partial [Burkholderiales bacterium]
MILRWLFLLLTLCGTLAHAADPELLDPEKAFEFSARVAGPDAIEVRYVIAKGYYLYRDKLRFSLEPATLGNGSAQLPQGLVHKDEFFGETQVYRDEVRIRLPVNAAGGIDRAVLTAVSQGCADVGVCYVPVEQKADLRLAAAGSAAGAGDGAMSRLFSGTGNAAQFPAAAKGEDAQIADLFHGDTWLLILSFFGFGLLLSFTPCVLPMVPILSGIIIGQGSRMTRAHSLLLSVAYVLGMAITYTLAGIAAGLSGALLSAAQISV